MHSASSSPFMMLTLAGVRDQPLDVTSTAGLPMLSSDTPNLPALLLPTIMMGTSVVSEAGSSMETTDASLLMLILESRFHL
jgi:hypothetical protein